MPGETIIIKEKPDSISWDSIHELLWLSHADNRKKGIYMKYPTLSGPEIEKRIKTGKGKMLVALDGSKLIGSSAILYKKIGLWCGGLEDVYGYSCFIGILPEYRGRGIYKELQLAIEKCAEENGVDKICFDTNKDNRSVIRMALSNGYRKIDYKLYPDHQSVILVKWLNHDEPFSRIYSVLKYHFLKMKRSFPFKPSDSQASHS